MAGKNISSFLIVITLISLGYAAFTVLSQRSSVVVPVTAKSALETVKSESTAQAFIAENFGLPEDRIERVSLVWDQTADEYMWEIEIQERSCGCRLNETEGVTILRASVDPEKGTILNMSTRVGVPEDQIKREACEKGCHTS